MKNTRAVVMIAISVAIGLAAVVAASRWMAQQASIATSRVVVAAKDLDLGARLAPDMLSLVEWPRGSVPTGAIEDQNALLKDPQTQEPRVVRTNILKGEPILESKLAPTGSTGGLSAVIEGGKRAITVKVNEVVGVAGFALPGNYVDILVNVQEDREKSVSKIVLEKIKVLAVAQEAQRDETKPKVVNAVTLEVTPQEAEKLDLARSVGTLSLVLRNQVDKTPVATAGARQKDILKFEPELAAKEKAETKTTAHPAPPARRIVVHKPAPTPPRDTDKVEIIKGVQKSDMAY